MQVQGRHQDPALPAGGPLSAEGLRLQRDPEANGSTETAPSCLDKDVRSSQRPYLTGRRQLTVEDYGSVVRLWHIRRACSCPGAVCTEKAPAHSAASCVSFSVCAAMRPGQAGACSLHASFRAPRPVHGRCRAHSSPELLGSNRGAHRVSGGRETSVLFHLQPRPWAGAAGRARGPSPAAPMCGPGHISLSPSLPPPSRS